jgi:chemotaxis protein methyltransferase CheR
MIYFDVEAKKTILRKVYDLLAPDGYLFLGAAETTMGLDERFERMPVPRTGCYRLAAGTKRRL